MTTPLVGSPLSAEVLRLPKKKRVLLVDATASTRDLRAEVMRKLGIEVDCAADIVEARSWWRADLYNLVLIAVENGPGQCDKFCEVIRKANPPQQLAFLVGKPEYLANTPNHEQMSSEPPQDNPVPAQVSAAPDRSTVRAQRWGILECSQRISVVRSACHARSRAIQQRSSPSRDSELRRSKRTLDELLREEMQ
jgi:CheY-like chemotaxis protein